MQCGHGRSAGGLCDYSSTEAPSAHKEPIVQPDGATELSPVLHTLAHADGRADTLTIECTDDCADDCADGEPEPGAVARAERCT